MGDLDQVIASALSEPVASISSLAAASSVTVRSSAGSLSAWMLASLVNAGHQICAVAPTEETARYLQSDIEQLLRGDDKVLYIPPGDKKEYDSGHVDNVAAMAARTDAVERLAGFTGAGVLVLSIESAARRVPARHDVSRETIVVQVGEQREPSRLLDDLSGLGFQAVEFVSQPGEVAFRGGIVDVFPWAGGYPLRLEFFGDEVDSVRAFDPATQRSVSRQTSARLVPNINSQPTASGVSPLTYLADNPVIATFDEAGFSDYLDDVHAAEAAAYEKAREERRSEHLLTPREQWLEAAEMASLLAQSRLVRFGSLAPRSDKEIKVASRPQPTYNGDILRLRADLESQERDGWKTTILCDSAAQRDRLYELLSPDDDHPPKAELIVESLHQGFELPGIKQAVYTDHQLFNRYHRPSARRRSVGRGGLTLRELKALSPGDYVVHVDHGIGQFRGLQTMRVRERFQEAVKLTFRGGDELFVNVSSLHKLHKYSGKEGTAPPLTKLGSGQWEKLKARTARRVKDIARDLIKLYAERKQASGFQFEADTIWQQEVEAAFPYIDTPDQASAVEAVKQDMQQSTPMDRLVCGDVGFGKTEVAVRAAFKAVQSGKQVAVIVPTTILAKQHYETFGRRLARYPVRIAQLSRFVSPADQKETMVALKEGAVDIVIGTHRLVSKDVSFKDLGLLVIDEEQRFGVGTKEKLRRLRPDVDTLTLTATPIPRTLQFSLMGARDLSIINTPPPNRQPIVTEIHAYDRDLVRDAVLYEIHRGGQVFFIHNRVRNIEEVTAMIQAMVPDARVRFAHGQLAASELEEVLVDFIDRKFDVLVCTNIVESGIDISNANTIIINNAQDFGLSDLHQLRGRVGRSDRKAFSYLLVPSVQGLTREAKMRLQAVEEFSELGAGFHVAMRDLDIRGAGALLGAEQSGFIEDVGYEAYHQILDEAVQELRRDEFSEVFGENTEPPAAEPVLDVDADAMIPVDYVSNHVERLNLYRRLSELSDPAGISALSDELEDRFGPLPEEVAALMAVARMKPLAQSLRLTRLAYRNQRLFLTLPAKPADAFFYEHRFEALLASLDTLPNRFVMKESKGGKLQAIVQDVKQFADAEEVLLELQPTIAMVSD